MNARSLFNAGLALLIYYAFFPVISPILSDFSGSGGYWSPLTVFMVAVLPIFLFIGILVGGVRDAQPR